MARSDVAAAPERTSAVRRFAPLAVLVLAVVLAFVFDLDRFVSLDTLSENRERLVSYVDRHAVLAALTYVGLYATVVALSIPGASVMTVAGGFLFGTWLGTALVVTGATAGATVVFLIARTALGDFLRAKAGPRIKRMEAGFRNDAFNYLLVLRLIPIFPFWLVNIVPAFLGVPLGTYALATFLGIIPGSFVFAGVGNGLGAVLEAGGKPDLGLLFEPEVLLPIAGLALLAILPVAYRKIKGRPAT